MDTKTKVIGGFLFGAALGAAAGILMAPRSGRKTRKKIKNESKRMADELIHKANKSLSEAKKDYQQKLEKLVNGGKSSVERLSEAVSSH